MLIKREKQSLSIVLLTCIITNRKSAPIKGCGCAGSEYGCCPDGEGQAEGPDFEGCATKPGEACHMKEEKGKLILHCKYNTL